MQTQFLSSCGFMPEAMPAPLTIEEIKLKNASIEIQLLDLLTAKQSNTIEITKQHFKKVLDGKLQLDVYQYGRFLRSFQEPDLLAAWLDAI